MKKLSRLFSAAFILFAAVSCGTKEIDHPDIPDTPQDSEITITASIIQTRVSYDCSDPGEVKQEWEVGDILFGYYHQKDTEPSTSNQIVFQVERVDPGTGIATLQVLPPEDWIDNATDKTVVDLVYTGGEAKFTNNGIDVDLSVQTLDRVPGCMHAQATLQIDGDGKKSLEFYFQNDCALIEIDGLTGFVEDWPGGSEISIDLSSVHITNLLLGGSYSFSNGELVFDSDEDSLEDDYAIELEPGWAVGKDGDVSGPHGEKILIAVAPNPVENEINVSAEKTSEMGTIQYPSYTYGERSLAGGLCYVISAQPVVAKTADGQCFKSVSAAFARAEELSDRYTTAADNVVTLIKKEIDGFGEQTASPTHTSTIGINYDVTLDLNGCALTIDESESFIVQGTGDFTITDSRYDDGTGYLWSWTPEEDVPVIENFGRVSITSAYVFSDNLTVDNEGGVLYVVGSDIQSFFDITINNTGEVKIFDSTITSGEVDHPKQKYYAGDYVINNEGKCSLEISNSKVSFFDGLYDGSQKTAVIYFKNSNTGENNLAYFKMDGGEVSGGTVTTGDNVVYSHAKAIQLLGNVKATISGDAVVNSDSHIAVTLAPIYDDEDEEVVSVPAGELTITGNSTVSSLTGPGVIKNKEGNLTISGNCTVSSKSNDANYGAIDNVGGTIKIEGGKIESTTYALYTDKEATITKGELISSGYNAIICWGGTLCIGDKNNANPDNNDILIKSSADNYSPAIDMLEGTMDVYYGQIIGNVGGAVWLEPDDLELPSIANIHGGYFENAELPTIQVRDGSACTITGGVIYNSGRNSAAVLCCSEVEENIATLEVKWSNGTGPEQPWDDDTPHEPLIVSAGINAPISAFLERDFDEGGTYIEDNTADIQIMGGYLISSGSQDAFYIDMEGNNLNLESNDGIFNFGNFYSNKTKVTKDGSSPGASNNTIDLYNGGSGNKIFNINTGEKFIANPQYVEEEDDEEDEEDEEPQLYSFTMPIIGGDSGGLYKIEKM